MGMSTHALEQRLISNLFLCSVSMLSLVSTGCESPSSFDRLAQKAPAQAVNGSGGSSSSGGGHDGGDVPTIDPTQDPVNNDQDEDSEQDADDQEDSDDMDCNSVANKRSVFHKKVEKFNPGESVERNLSLVGTGASQACVRTWIG